VNELESKVKDIVLKVVEIKGFGKPLADMYSEFSAAVTGLGKVIRHLGQPTY
jgi:hypothetical protein